MTTQKTHDRDPVVLAILGEIKLKPRAGLTDADIEAYLARKRAEAQRIDPNNCESGCWHTEAADPYRLFEIPSELGCIQREEFVRNRPDGDWVWDGDLPGETRERLRQQARVNERVHEIAKLLLAIEEARSEARCRVCDRDLTDSESIARCVGPECWPDVHKEIEELREASRQEPEEPF